MRQRSRIRLGLACAAIVFLPIFGLLYAWFAPFGSGEHRESPDGRHTAEVYNMSVGTFFGERDPYILFRVIENATHREVCRVICSHPAEADVPDYSVRGMKFVEWSPDSASVSVPVGEGRQMSIPVQ